MNTLWSALLVGFGGSIGTLLRYGIGRLATANGKPGFYGTLFVNLTGSLAMGVFIGLQLEQEHLEIYAIAGIGILGGFTTYSTLNVQKATMFAKGPKRTLVFYLVATYVGGFVFTASGVGLGYLIHT
ncbi:fluoride efflux transporter FluC [Cohnella luojiensis]|uniref:Fluoride-specific ion channel FluC n=1 Tax=Cohnella luojiensis TaxID=652876 RepID=A0A4Y8M723_9BACL|nr:CrcB family protein [Cohnella luojiensis]TFE31796.1 CrcB family protein [Cohnella luojiensis]